MRTLAISNYKGGVGKTTTAVNLATIYAERGQRVLLIDLDPQASATDFFGLYERAEAERRTSVELLYGDAPVADVAYETGIEGLSVVPSVIDLIDQNELLLREQRLKSALDDAAGDFDTCIIDCSPVMKRLAFNAYLAASGSGMIVIPVKLDGSVMRGTALTVSAMRAIADALRMATPKFRILRTCVPGRETRSEATGAQVLDSFFPDEQFSTVIHASTKVGEGSWQWKPVVAFEPRSRPPGTTWRSRRRSTMSARSDVAAGFSISGLLDSSSKTRSRFPVVEIPVSEIGDHPENTAYSMDEAGIRALADSIGRDGLTDLPLVRKLPDGSWQMLSGHRRKAAYAMLAKRDGAYAKMPCRVVEGVDDAQALVLLHTANYFVRELSITERAAATRALGIEVGRKRLEDPSLSGKRTEDVKADILAEQTGRRVSGKTIRREEALAKAIEDDLADEWKAAADTGEISAKTVSLLAALPRAEQSRIASEVSLEGLGKRQRTDAIQAAIGSVTRPDARLSRSRKNLAGYAASMGATIAKADLETIGEIAGIVRELQERAASDADSSAEGVRCQS
ncbi:AAA family ATPase [Curtanaerobium respiraculi]|uniref:AAA family ATPase n=1 Tax=Curtanaerobium respiraculi TaxID=2949669 RepID=UPI0024B37989|nr:AAA family ATPase [Curtanaerobium respiraculi]